MVARVGKKFNIGPYLFLVPYLFFFVLFMVVPILTGLFVSFHKWDFLSSPQFVGLRNYIRLFTPGTIDYTEFWSALLSTFKFVIFSVPFIVTLPLILAILLNRDMKLKNTFRCIFYAPAVLSVSSVALIWVWLLDTHAGLVNYYVFKWFGERISWLTSQPYAWISLVGMTVWWVIGGNFILFLAGLQDIPKCLYEAATVDGCNGWQKFKHITIPGLKKTLIYVLIMTTIAQFNVFGQPHMVTNGGPGTSTKVVLMYIRDVAFSSYRVGSATAMSLVLGIIMIVFSIIQFKVMNSKGD